MKGDLVQEKGWNWRKVSGKPARENLMRRLPVGIVAVALLALFGAGPRLTAQAPAGSEETPPAIVYVADTNNGVSEVNSANNSVVATAPFGGIGAATAVTPDGKRFYVTDYLSANVTVFDAATNVPVAQIPVGSGKGNIGVAVTPDGSTVYVTSQMDGIVTVIATATSTVVRTIATGTEPVWVMISPDGSHVYVSNQVSGTVSVIATATNQVVANIGGLGCPYGTRLTRYGTQLLVADQCGNSLHVVNTATNTVIKSIPTGLTPKGVAVTPDGERAYVSDFGSNTVDVIDLNTLTNLGKPITVGTNPRGLAVAPGGHLYVANFGGVTVSVINTETNQVTATLQVRPGPADVTVSTTARPRILKYSFLAFDVPGSANTISASINNRGQVVGYFTDSGGVYRGFLRDSDGSIVTIDPPGSSGSNALGIDDEGTVVGVWLASNGTVLHGFKRSPSGMYTTVDFPGAVDSGVSGINDQGVLVGAFDLGNMSTNIAFIDVHGTFTSFEAPQAAPMQTVAYGINLENFVSGNFTDPAGTDHGFVRNPKGEFETIDFPSADSTDGFTINDLGQVAGHYIENFPHGFILSGAMSPTGRPSSSQFFSLDYPDSKNTLVLGINNRGQVAGRFHLFGDPVGAGHGFIATPRE